MRSDDVAAVVAAALSREPRDCVLLGGGLRGGDVELFEALVNLVRVHAPQASIAFNAAPDDLLGPVRRQLG